MRFQVPTRGGLVSRVVLGCGLEPAPNTTEGNQFMRSGNATAHARILRMFQRNAQSAIEARLSRVRVEDTVLEGDILTIDGQRTVNFGSCAYLGLNLDQRLKDAAVLAIDQYGPVFSSSTAYTSIPLYTELEELLQSICQRPTVVPTTTTLGHLACLPVMIGPGDAVIIDGQAHASVHQATQQLIGQEIPVRVLAHNDMNELDETLAQLSPRHRKIWYLADGVYSMHGDTIPIDAIADRLANHPNLWAYIDDAHGFGWRGRSGRGLVLDALGSHDRVIVAASLSKSFGSGGAAIAFPDHELAQRVQILGGTLTFSGPIHPAELGAAVASARLHLSDAHTSLQLRMTHQIDLVASNIRNLGLPVASMAATPIWFARIGQHEQAIEVGRRMMKDGFFLNLASFPAVPPGESGLRFTNTLYHSDDQIISMLEALHANIDAVVGDTGIVVDLTGQEAILDPVAG